MTIAYFHESMSEKCDIMDKGEDMNKLERLKELLKSYQKVAIAYSGGCDSNFLYQVALQTLGKENVLAVLCIGKMMPKEDIDSAKIMADNGQLIEVPLDVFAIKQFVNNQKDRCYHCKKQVMATVIETAHHNDFKVILDGKNADDEKVYRPGMKACEELGILSPLALVGLTKEEIRQYSKELQIATYDKPANACLASRFPYDTLLNEEKLEMVDQAEALLHQKGMIYTRVRVHDKLARIEVEKDHFHMVIDDELVSAIKKLGFDYVTLDLEGITSGSYDR